MVNCCSFRIEVRPRGLAALLRTASAAKSSRGPDVCQESLWQSRRYVGSATRYETWIPTKWTEITGRATAARRTEYPSKPRRKPNHFRMLEGSLMGKGVSDALRRVICYP